MILTNIQISQVTPQLYSTDSIQHDIMKHRVRHGHTGWLLGYGKSYLLDQMYLFDLVAYSLDLRG